MSDKAYTITNESVSIVLQGTMYTLKRGDPNFSAARKAILSEKWELVRTLVSKGLSLEDWAKGDFTFRDNHMHYQGNRIPSELNQRMGSMAAAGDDPSIWMQFWARLQKNPSYRSVKQLYSFLEHGNIPLSQDGCILAYKSVRRDYKDHHSGTFDNSIGQVLKMPRNQISDDPKDACSKGFHLGTLSYVKEFREASNSRTLVCKVDPADVVCIPYDADAHKMRICQYEVIGHYGDPLPDTVFDTTEEPAPENIPAPPKKQADDMEGSVAAFASGLITKGTVAPVASPSDPFASRLAELEKLPKSGLGSLGLGDLRKYATRLGIVKGSRMTKTVLLGRILEERGSKPSPKKNPSYRSGPAASAGESFVGALVNIGLVPKATKPSGPVDLASLSDEELKKEGVGDLRKYATRLGIVNGSRMTKAVLLERILDVRRE